MRRQTELKEWDISFYMNGELLNNILLYASQIDTDIPIFFFDNRISVKVLDPSHSSYARVEIPKEAVIEYQIKKPRAVILGSKVIGEFRPFIGKDSIVEVKLDTMVMKKIQFKFPPHMTLLSKLLAPTEAHYGYEKLENNMKAWMDKNAALTQNFVINNEILTKVCSLGSDTDVITMTAHENGMLGVVSANDSIERIMQIDPANVDVNVGKPKREDFEGGDNFVEDETENEIGNDSVPEFVSKFQEIEIMLERAYLEPLLKLKGLGTMMLSILPGGLPLVINYIPYNDIRVLQTVALRIESSADKD